MLLTPTDLAKYPFTPQAAEHVQKLDLKITELDSPEDKRIVERAQERIEEAINSALISDKTRNEEIETLSFPIAVMIVAATGDPFLKRRYALAEAKRAYNILKQETEQKLNEIARLFSWKIEPTETDGTVSQTVRADFFLHFTDYLKNTGNFHETKWKLVNRTMVRGVVNLAKDETARLLAEEVRAHVERRLEPELNLNLPQGIIDKADSLRQLFLAKKGKITQEEMPKETVIEAFPPCIKQLQKAAQDGQHISHIGRFALTSFLIYSGMTTELVIECFRPESDFSERMTRYQVEHIAGGRGSRTKYIPPRCETLRTHGLCPGMDEICRRVHHPLSYYRRKVRLPKSRTTRATT
jgi:DNA primase large subunit